MIKVNRIVRDLLRRIGYDVTRYIPGEFGRDPFQDIQFLLKREKCPVIFDVGANIGQSVDNFKRIFPGSFIHSFEPSSPTYAKLSAHCRGLDGVKTWNYGLGSRQTTLPLLENTCPDMSSFLTPGESSWGKIDKTTEVDVITLDNFAMAHEIDYIHVLKSDTQGYEFEVFKGAEEMMKEDRIGLIYFEFIFSKMYHGLPAFHEVCRFLSERKFSPVGFYDPHFQKELLGWTDVLFINDNYQRQRVEQTLAADAANTNC